MRVPSSNLLRMARKVIHFAPLPYLNYVGRALNAARQYAPQYEAPHDILASVQAVPRDKYVELGLDLQKVYIKVFADVDTLDLERDSSSDRMIWRGRTYQIQSDTDWFQQDGWTSCYAILISPVVGGG